MHFLINQFDYKSHWVYLDKWELLKHGWQLPRYFHDFHSKITVVDAGDATAVWFYFSKRKVLLVVEIFLKSCVISELSSEKLLKLSYWCEGKEKRKWINLQYFMLDIFGASKVEQKQKKKSFLLIRKKIERKKNSRKKWRTEYFTSKFIESELNKHYPFSS